MKTGTIFTLLLLIACTLSSSAQTAESFYLAKSVPGTLDKVVLTVKAELKNHGFGIITEIDMQKSLKEKLDVDIPAYHIYGVCNVKLAHQLLQQEENIGVILPCKMIIKQINDTTVEVVFIDPEQLIDITGNNELTAIGKQVKEAFEKVLASL